MNECQNLALDIANAVQQIFDLGGWNACIWVVIGFGLGGGWARTYEWFESRRAA
jgi:hypothetical protein